MIMIIHISILFIKKERFKMEIIGFISMLIGISCFFIGLVLLSINGVLSLLSKFNINALTQLHNNKLFKDIKKQIYLLIASFFVFIAGGIILPKNQDSAVESET